MEHTNTKCNELYNTIEMICNNSHINLVIITIYLTFSRFESIIYIIYRILTKIDLNNLAFIPRNRVPVRCKKCLQV